MWGRGHFVSKAIYIFKMSVQFSIYYLFQENKIPSSEWVLFQIFDTTTFFL
jgi:hypothetical protein